MNRRLLCTLTFVAVTAMGGAFGHWLIHEFGDAPSDETTSELHQIGSYNAIIEARPQFMAAVRNVQQNVRDQPGVLRAANPTIAAATVQDTVRQMLTTVGGQIRSSQPLPKAREGDFDLVRVQYDIVVPANRLGDLVYTIEAHRPYFFIDSVDIQTPQTNLQQSTGAGVALAQVHWIISSYLVSPS